MVGGKLKSLFKRKKKEEEQTPWGEPIKKPPKENKKSFISYLRSGGSGFKNRFSEIAPENKIHIKYLLKVKRVLAGFLCIVYFFSFLLTVPNSISIMFFITSFLFLDYLWKTRVVKWVRGEEET